MIVTPGDAVGVYGQGGTRGTTTSVGSPGVVGRGSDRSGLNSDRMQGGSVWELLLSGGVQRERVRHLGFRHRRRIQWRLVTGMVLD
jgi:hypothetical protein